MSDRLTGCVFGFPKTRRAVSVDCFVFRKDEMIRQERKIRLVSLTAASGRSRAGADVRGRCMPQVFDGKNRKRARDSEIRYGRTIIMTALIKAKTLIEVRMSILLVSSVGSSTKHVMEVVV